MRAGTSKIAESSGGRPARAATCPTGSDRPETWRVSLIACVNFLLPLIDVPNALTAVLQALDDDVTACADIPGQGTSSPVELEWIGLDHALEGPAVKSRGANSTSVDAFMIAETPVGRRAYLMEWKYVEEYRTDDKGKGRQGRTRRSRYAPPLRRVPRVQGRCPLRGPGCLNRSTRSCGFACLPTGLVRNRELGVSESKVVVVVPEGNRAYRERVTSPWFATRYPDRGVSDIVRQTLVEPDRRYAAVSQRTLCRRRTASV